MFIGNNRPAHASALGAVVLFVAATLAGCPLPAPLLTLSVSPSSLEFGLDLTPRTLQVFNSSPGGRTLRYVATTEDPWITLTNAQGFSTGPEDQGNITVGIDSTQLPEGNQTGEILVTTEVGTRRVTVSARGPVPNPTIDQDTLEFALNTGPLVVNVSNTGDARSAFVFTAQASDPWLSVTPLQGAVSDTPVALSVTVDQALLPERTNTGAITIEAGDETLDVTVTATRPEAAISVTPDSVNFGLTRDPVTLAITNSGDAGSTLTVQVSEEADWLSVNPDTGTSTGPDDPIAVTLTVNEAALEPGNNTTELRIASGNATETVTVIARGPKPRINVSPTTLDFLAGAGPLVVAIANNGDPGSVLEYTASPNRDWIVMDVTEGTSTGPSDGDFLEVRVDRAALEPGINTGEILFEAPGLDSVAVQVAARSELVVLQLADLTGGEYAPGGTQDVQATLQLDAEEPIDTLTLTMVFPNAWTFDSVTGATFPDQIVRPTEDVNTYEFTFDTVPADAIQFSVRHTIPTNGAGDLPVSAQAEYTVGGETRTSNPDEITVDGPPLNSEGNAVLSVTGDTLDFGLGRDPQTFVVFNDGDPGSVLNFEVATGADWLTASPTIGSSDGPDTRVTITVGIDEANLPAGDNSSTVDVTSSVGNASVTVTARGPAAVLTASPTAIDFGTARDTRTVTVGNDGDPGSALSFTATTNDAWLVVTGGSASGIGPGDTADFTVGIDESELAPGANAGTVVIDTNVGSTSISVTATGPEAELSVTPGSVAFGLGRGAQTITVSNNGDTGSALTFSAEKTGAWLLLSTSGGTLAGGESTTLALTVDESEIDEGENTGSVTVSDGTDSVTVTVTALGAETEPTLFIEQQYFDEDSGVLVDEIPYTPGGTLTIRVRFTYEGTDTITSLGATQELPPQWGYDDLIGIGNDPDAVQVDGQLVSFGYIDVPAFPTGFIYRIDAPTSNFPDVIFGEGLFRTFDPQLFSPRTVQLLRPERAGLQDALTMTRTVQGGDEFTPGETVSVEVTLDYTAADVASLEEVTVQEYLHPDWTFVGVDAGTELPNAMADADTGLVVFGWSSVPSFPVSFVYTVTPAAWHQYDKTLTGFGTCRIGSDEYGTAQVTNTLTAITSR